MADNEFVVKLTGDLSAIERDLASLTNRLAGVTGGLKEAGNSADNMASKSKAAGAATAGLNKSLSTTRYALYDISRGFAVAGVALLALGLAPAKVAINFQREFANVSRTVQGAGEATKQALIGLSTELPTSFKSLTEIATLGGQLGIAKSGIISFTDTVAKLTATTNLSAEVAGTALGRFKSFGLVTTDQFANLASAILKVGVNSVATETQIVGIATGIAGIGKVAGLSAATLVGYAGALASVGIQQYAARGTTQRLLTDIQKAASNGGPALTTFAKIAGVSADTIKKSFGTSQFSPIFESLISNLGDTSRTGTDLNTTLGKLGISSVIDRRTLLQLSAAPKAVAQAFADANSGIRSGATLNEQYGKIATTTAAKITILGNSFQALLNAIGSAQTGPIGGLVEGLTGILKTLSDLASNPAGQIFLTIASSAAVLLGVVSLLAAAGLRAYGGMIALYQGLIGINAEARVTGGLLAGITAEMTAMGGAGAVAARGIGLVGLAMRGLLIGALVVGVTQGLGFFAKLGDNALNAKIDIDKLADSTKRVGSNLTNSNRELERFIKAANPAKSSLTISPGTPDLSSFRHITGEIAQEVTGINGSFTSSGSPMKALNDFLGGFPGRLSGLTQAREAVDKVDGALAKLVKSGNAKQASALMSHLLAGAAGSGANLKDFSAQFKQYNEALKESAVASKAAASANSALDASRPFNLVKTLKDLSGLDDKGLQKYAAAYAKSVAPLTDFNNVVKQIQDTQKAALPDQATATQQQEAQNVSLSSLTKQYEANNQAQAQWAGNLAAISAVAGPAAAQPFIDAGYSAVNNSILQQLVNATPAQRDAYIAAQQESADLASAAMAQRLLASGFLVTAAGGTVGIDTAKKLAAGIQAGLPVEAIMASLGLRFRNNAPTVVVHTDAARDAIEGIVRYGNSQVINIPVNTYGNAMYNVAPGGRMVPQGSTGGLFDGDRFHYSNGGGVFGAGTGTSDDVPAWLSNGEYVIKAQAVRAVGYEFLNAVNKGYKPRQYASGGPTAAAPASGMGGVVELGPRSLGVLREAVLKDMAIHIGDEAIARASDRGHAKMGGRGAK